MNKRVVIIGGGVVGLCTAWYLTQRGISVTVIDRNPARRAGCSFGNAGMLVPSHVIPLAAPGMIRLGLKWMWNPRSPFYIQPRASWELVNWLWQFKKRCTAKHVQQSAPLLRDMHFRSRSLYESMEADLPGGFGLTQYGLLVLCRTESGLQAEAETAEYANRLDVPAQVLGPTETAALDPGVTMDVAGSVYYEQDCHLSPDRLMLALQTSLLDKGCQFLWDREVTGFAVRGDEVFAVRFDEDEMSADEVVLCGGVWSGTIARQLRIALPMQAGKGYSVTLDHPVQQPKICSLLHEARVAVTPIGGALRVGGTMEMSGLDESITDSRVRGIIDSFVDYYPKFKVQDFEGLTPWHGLRPCSPDGLPYLGRSNNWKNVTVSTGHAMMGISLAAVSGEWIADLIDRRKPRIDSANLLSVDRFAR